jgi:hypothetical protein
MTVVSLMLTLVDAGGESVFALELMAVGLIFEDEGPMKFEEA